MYMPYSSTNELYHLFKENEIPEIQNSTSMIEFIILYLLIHDRERVKRIGSPPAREWRGSRDCHGWVDRISNGKSTSSQSSSEGWPAAPTQKTFVGFLANLAGLWVSTFQWGTWELGASLFVRFKHLGELKKALGQCGFC